MGAEDQLRKQAQQGAMNLAAMTPEEQQQAMSQLFANLASQLQSAQQAGTDPYSEALAAFGATRITPLGAPLGAAFSYAPPDVERSPDGSLIRYKNGVIADVLSRQLIPGPWVADPDVEGSDAWLQSIQQDWKPSQIKSWRTKLAKMGYEVAESGGWAEDLIAGLQQYHTLRYLNSGKPLPLRPTTQETREVIEERVDFKELETRIAEQWGDVVFGEPLNKATARWLARDVMDWMNKLAKRKPTWSFEQIQAGAELRAQERFAERPVVKSAIREAEEDEMDETLRESIVSISQLASI